MDLFQQQCVQMANRVLTSGRLLYDNDGALLNGIDFCCFILIIGYLLSRCSQDSIILDTF